MTDTKKRPGRRHLDGTAAGEQPTDPSVSRSVTLPASVAEGLRELGRGNLSRGIREIYQQEEASKMSFGEKMFDLFVSRHATVAEIAAMDEATVARQIKELRDSEPDTIQATSGEIAQAILDFARSQ